MKKQVTEREYDILFINTKNSTQCHILFTNMHICKSKKKKKKPAWEK